MSENNNKNNLWFNEPENNKRKKQSKSSAQKRNAQTKNRNPAVNKQAQKPGQNAQAQRNTQNRQQPQRNAQTGQTGNHSQQRQVNKSVPQQQNARQAQQKQQQSRNKQNVQNLNPAKAKKQQEAEEAARKERIRKAQEEKAKREAAAEKQKQEQLQKSLEAQKAKEEKEKQKQERKEAREKEKQENQAMRRSIAGKSAESRAVRNGFLGAVVVVAAVLVLVFVIHHLYNYIAEKPEYEFVTSGTVEHTIGAKALIVRDEEVITSTVSGDLVTSITEGSRVAKGQRLALVVPENLASVVSDLRNVQSQISEVQQEIIARGEVTQAETIYDTYDDNLISVIDGMRFEAMNGNLSNLASYNASVSVILDEREGELEEVDFDDERLTVLRDDEMVYESQLENSAFVITSESPGIISFRLDGMESDLDFETFLEKDAGAVIDAIDEAGSAISSDLYIESGDPVARLAQNDEQYLSVYLSLTDAGVSDFAVGTYHDINVPSEGIAIDDCEVVRCEPDESGMLITFVTTRYVEDLLDLRSVDIEIVISESTGMRVSMSSLTDSFVADTVDETFSLYFPQSEGLSEEMFTEGNIFNLSAIPLQATDENGEDVDPSSLSVSACTVLYADTLADGGTIVIFSTSNSINEFIKINTYYTESATGGYKLTLIDSTSGLGTDVSTVTPVKSSGIGTLYYNNRGFVEEVRVIVIDSDREFAIVEPIGSSKLPDYNTVIVTNPSSCKPGDKVD